MLPLVSVIIPVYNVKDYLRESVDSVIDQTYKDLEIILVDDGSSDGSGKICDEYLSRDNRIRVIHQVNQGLSTARNTGLDAMHGDIVAFLDSDDAFMPDMICTMVKGMLRTGAEIAVCGFYSCRTTKRMKASQSDRVFRTMQGVVSSETALRYLIDERINVNVWNKLYKKEIFESLRFPDGHDYEDLILTPFLTEKAHKVLLLEKQLVLYRLREKSITSSINPQNTSDWLYAVRQWYDFAAIRTPLVFSKEDMKHIREAVLTWLLGKKLTLLSLKSSSMTGSIREVEDAIRFYSGQPGRLSPKVRMYLLLVDTVPGLTLLIKKYYRLIRNHYERFRSGLHSKREK